MSGPTREELAWRLRRNAKWMDEGASTEDVAPLMREAAAALEGSLPPEGGERERKAQWLEGFGVEPQPRDYTRQMFSAEVRAEFRATAALLRQPPAAGVSKEAVLAICARLRGEWDHLEWGEYAVDTFLSAIEALPEAAPPNVEPTVDFSARLRE